MIKVAINTVKMFFYQLIYRTFRIVRRLIPKIVIENYYSLILDNHIDTYDVKDGLVNQKIGLESLTDMSSIWKVNLSLMSSRILESHSDCFITYEDENSIAYLWAQHSGLHHVQQFAMDVNIHKSKRSIIIYHVRVKSGIQSKGVGTFSYSNLLTYYKNLGFYKALIYTSSTNKANIRCLKKLNFILDFQTISIKWNNKYYGVFGRDRLSNWLK